MLESFHTSYGIGTVEFAEGNEEIEKKMYQALEYFIWELYLICDPPLLALPSTIFSFLKR